MNKVGKKFLALTLVSAMTVTGLAACGSNDSSSSGSDSGSAPADTEAPADAADDAADAADDASGEDAADAAGGEGQVLKVAAFNGGNGTEIWDKIKAAFEEANPGVTIDLHMSSELDKDLTKSIQNGDFPDIVYYNLGQPSGFTETMLKEQAVLDISDIFDDELKGRLVDGILDGTDAQPYGDGKIYLAPIFYTPTGFWYNKNLFEGDDAKYELPTTWEEMFALGDQLNAEGGDTALFTYPIKGYFDATIYTMLEQAGGLDFYKNALNYDAGTWTSDEGRKVLDTVGTLVSKYTQADTVSNANTDGGFKINQQNVIDGKALFMPNGNWVIAEMANSTPEEFQWGMMPAPKWEGDTTQAVYTFTEQMWIPADAENVDLAKEFIKFMYSDTVVDILLNNTTTNAETGEVSKAPILAPVKGASDSLDEGTTKDCYALYNGEGIVPVTGTWATTQPIEGLNMKEAVYGPIDSICTGDMTVDQWQQQLIETWEKCAANLN